MDNLMIKGTKSTPEILFDYSLNLLEVSGSSYPENASEFYAPIFKWVREYIKDLGNREVNVNMEIAYFNSSTSKVFFDLFDLLDKAAGNGKNININWFYNKENISAKKNGEEFCEDFEFLKFNVIQKD